MANREFKKCVFRVLTDLIKSDNVISASEMDALQDICNSMGIDDEIKAESCGCTLASAASYIASMTEKNREQVVRMMEDCSLKDGECCRAEALLISAIDIVNAGKGFVSSMEFNNRPILSTQILYVDSTYNPRKNELDRDFDNLNRIVGMSGFELIYIPRIASEFKEFKSTEDLRRLLSLVNPALSDSDVSNKVSSIQDMDSRYFYLHVLNDKLDMKLHIDSPVWMVRLPNSVVNGIGYANFLCIHVDLEDICGQLVRFTDSLNRRQAPYAVTVNTRSDKAKDFLYGGFHKALLDVMAMKKTEKTELWVYVRGGNAPSLEGRNSEKKYTVAFVKGENVHPIYINGREAAFYLLLLLGSAGPRGGVDFEYRSKAATQVLLEQFEEAYRLVSDRENAPDITVSSNFRPIKTNVIKALEALDEEFTVAKQKAALFLLKPSKKEKKTFYIPFASENVKIISAGGPVSLTESIIFTRFCMLEKRAGR